MFELMFVVIGNLVQILRHLLTLVKFFELDLSGLLKLQHVEFLSYLLGLVVFITAQRIHHHSATGRTTRYSQPIRTIHRHTSHTFIVRLKCLGDIAREIQHIQFTTLGTKDKSISVQFGAADALVGQNITAVFARGRV